MAEKIKIFFALEFFPIKETGEAKRVLMKTNIPVGNNNLQNIANQAKELVKKLKFKPALALVKESPFTGLDGESNYHSSPSRVGKGPFKAFILKKKGDTIRKEGKGIYYINEKKIDFPFQDYEINIVKID